MRKNFLYIVIIPFVIIFVILWIFHNQWIESGLEYGGEEIIGAKVEIDDLNLTLFPIGIEFSRLQVANPHDPWENLIETDSVKFDMDAEQLLRGKYIINEIAVHNVSIGTKRKTDGSISQERKNRAILAGDKFTFSGLAENALNNLVTTTPLFDLAKLKNGFNADSLVSILDVKSLQHLDTLEVKVNNLTSNWDGIKNDFESSKTKVLEVEEQVNNIDVNKLKDVQNITNTIATVNNALSTVNEIKELVETRTTGVKTNLSALTTSLGLVDNIVKSDFQKLKDMARLPSFNSDGMAQMLVGTEMYKRAGRYLNWVDLARSNVEEYSPEPEKEEVPRMEGQDIDFPAEKGFPKIWIKKALLSASSEKYIDSTLFNASGSISNYSDNQKVTGLPFTIELAGTYRKLRSLKLQAVLDRTGDIATDTYTINLDGIPVDNFTLGKTEFLPSTIKHSVMNTKVKLSVPGETMKAEIKTTLKDLELLFNAKPKNMAEEIVHRVLSGIAELDINMSFGNVDGPFKLTLSTNLDQKISGEIQKILGQELTNLQNQLRAKFDAKVMPQINKLKSNYESKLSNVFDGVSNYETLFSNKRDIVEEKKKELEKRLDDARKWFS